MALDKTKKSNRLLQSKRYTMEQSTDAQEAFTRTIDINAGDVYIRENFVPENNLPYSGSGQNQATLQSASVDVVKFHFQHQLTPSSVVNGSKTEVFFFISKSSHDPTVAVTPQIIQDGQQTSFLSPKYSDASLTFKNTEDNVPAGNGTPGYNVTIRVNGTEQDAAFYQFDYKTGVVQFVDNSVAPTTGDTVVMSAYQYVGPTLADGGIGSGAGFPFSGSAQITGSVGGVPGGFAVTGSSTFDVSGTGDEFKIESAPIQDFPFLLTYATGSGKIGYVEISSGTSGLAGTSGTSGISGTAGSSGSNGSSGGSGIAGTSGIASTSGTTGSSGSNGENGIAGTSGIDSTSGTSGSSGSNGENGIAGTSGIASTSGTTGSSGSNGENGVAGTSGADSTSGTSGSSGSVGSSGLAGASGLSQTAGSSGSSGEDGTSGVASTSGTSGSSGSNGENGIAGTSGVDSTSGTSGSSG